MHKTRSAYQQINATVDMNPMLDIVFILLIFFIVTASFNRDTVLDIERTKNNINTIQPTLIPQFTIDSQNHIFLNQRQVEVDTINVNIARLAAIGDINSISLRAHPNSQHNTLVSVLNAIKAQTSAPVSIGEILN
ncbi:biopolymer transporter ExbD [Pseudoalteromonas sp. MMG012]|uniref:ExbD/TolR family protein n=1 Tax=Pseudoalteromonas sp. MMG012 TaxID=2822686 RepID=UPI001B3A7365|nr:biopolymer transporter ExbD [Pseudoalteromonas sp. MMG012]MBQ4852316.1 biopolymer transporter ExbD [Pseudoalteromonas sp. MMG012]